MKQRATRRRGKSASSAVQRLLVVIFLYKKDRAVRRPKKQANYINALAVSVSPFFEPAKGTLGGFFFLCGWIFYDIGGIFYDIG
jgi:hypothetical protein